MMQLMMNQHIKDLGYPKDKTYPQRQKVMIFMVNDNQVIDSNSVTIFHQNICGLRRKTDELISFPIFCVFMNTNLKNLNLIQLMLMAINLVLHTVDKLLREAVFVCLFEIT
jgi:hypothetical protein